MNNSFQFWTQWEEDGSTFAQLHNYTDLSAARRSHTDACRGMWVKRQMKLPHVSALNVIKEGYVLREELAGKQDIPEFGRSTVESEAA